MEVELHSDVPSDRVRGACGVRECREGDATVMRAAQAQTNVAMMREGLRRAEGG